MKGFSFYRPVKIDMEKPLPKGIKLSLFSFIDYYQVVLVANDSPLPCVYGDIHNVVESPYGEYMEYLFYDLVYIGNKRQIKLINEITIMINDVNQHKMTLKDFLIKIDEETKAVLKSSISRHIPDYKGIV